jgi:phosphomannomutase
VTEIAELLDEVEAWMDQDPDPETRGELRELLAGLLKTATSAAAYDGLADRFSGMLQFGTAGLRGELGAGPNRMNRVVVGRAAAGLAAYLIAKGHAEDLVVIGYDARKNSDVFAHDTAEIVTGAGLRAAVLPHPLPTPVLAFMIRHLGACAGVMVTASHNPPQDNGYKVYLGDGSQITPPADAEIAAEIAAVGPVNELPRGEVWETLDNAEVDAYLDRAATVVNPQTPRDLKVVSTALHGVGGALLGDAFERAGFARPIAVPQQQEPDAAFPTVAFPNPEEPGAIDLALALAAEESADIVIANDPDAEVGTLLGAALAERGGDGVFATTIVSSSLLGEIAAAHGFGYQETLTGFKWISKIPGLIFGYEEALGYCVDPGGVRDKDGITAALAIAEHAAVLKASGKTMLERLAEIYARYGTHVTDQLSLRVSDLAEIPRMMVALRQDPPKELGGLAVQQVDDLTQGTDTLPPTDGLRFVLDGARVVVRPSGTEPKLKCYLEAGSAEVLTAIKDSLGAILGA